MKKIIFVLVYALAALAVFSYSTVQENGKVKRLLHAGYTDQMAQASAKLDTLQQSVQQTLLFNDSQALKEPLSNISRLSSEIRTSIAGLPIDQQFANEWMNYLGRLGSHAQLVSESKESSEKWHENAVNVATNLRELSSEWEVATAHFFQQDKNYNTWLKQLSSPERNGQWSGLSQTVKGYSESDFPMTASETDLQKKKELSELGDEPITEKQAIARFKEIFPAYENATISVSKSKKDAPYPFYHVQFHDGIKLGYADITERGGHLLSFLVDRPVDKNFLPQEQLAEMAKQSMASLGFKDVELIESRENHIVWHFVFVRVNPSNRAKIYADGVQIKLAKDNGEVLGVNAIEYIQKENLKDQPINKLNWGTFFQKNVEIISEDLAYAENANFEQRLCYELVIKSMVHNTNQTFRVLVDTETGKVLKTEQLP